MTGNVLRLVPGQLDLELQAGDDDGFQLSIPSSMLTGWSFAAQVRRQPGSAGDPLGAFTFGSPALGDDGVPRVPVYLSSALTRALSGANAVYDLQATGPGGYPVKTLCAGRITVQLDVTV